MIVEKIANHSLECLSVGVWEAGLHSTLMWGLGHEKKKKKTCFTGTTNQIFHFGRFFSSFYQNFVKLPLFWPKSKNFSWKFLKISQNIFPKFFCKKCLVFFTVFRVILLPEMKKKANKQTNKNKKSKTKQKNARSTDSTWQVCPPMTQVLPPPHGLTTPTT